VLTKFAIVFDKKISRRLLQYKRVENPPRKKIAYNITTQVEGELFQNTQN
jgi:hypothetical protein